MKPNFSDSYIDALFVPGQYENLAEISSLLRGSGACVPEKDDYGLGPQIFVLVEGLLWFAQGLRSGAWTYFEVTPQPRQIRMLATLKAMGPIGFAEQYECGMKSWQDETAMQKLDRWMEEHDDENNLWLWRLAQEQKACVLQTVA